MYPQAYNHPFGNLNVYDPGVRQWIAQNHPHMVHMLPQYPQQQQFQPQQYAAAPPPAAPDFGLSLAEQQFLYQNANLIPAFYQTADGKALNKMLVEGLQKMLGGSSGATTTTAAAQSGQTAG